MMMMKFQQRMITVILGISLAAVIGWATSAPAQQLTPAANMAIPAGVTAWPQRVESPQGLITVYQPQPSQFEGDVLTARAAVSLTPTGAGDPEFGALWFTARVVTDRDARVVAIQNITIRQVKLPNASPDQEQQFGQVLEQQVPGMNLMLSLDQLESTLGIVQKAREEATQLDNKPPNIVFTTTPTTLVQLDGDPRLQATATQGVMNVVNTPFILLLDLNTKQYFLKAGQYWMVTPDLKGPWSQSGSVPGEVVAAGKQLSVQNPPAEASAQQPAAPTDVLVAEQPTEVISSTGTPQYTPVPNGDLLYMTNTSSDVFLEVASQQYFVLLSGRWFASRALTGPWGFVPSDKLPSGFAQIPADSPKANVLVSVAGTQQAKDARLDAYIPQTTAIRRDAGTNLSVSYDGDPQFVPVADTPITYASNCADPVLFVQNGYYCCHQAVWYQSANPRGPWLVSTAVPQAIYTLPPSCPVYNCRYVYVYDSTPDLVYCGYLPGYTGCYVYGPTIVYGTGYTYPYWYGHEFYPHPYTWGFGATYDYYAGTWGYGVGFSYGPTWFANRPQRQSWFGPQGYVDYREVRQRYSGGYSNGGGSSNRVYIQNNRTDIHNVTVNRIDIYNRQENVTRNVNVRNETINHATPVRAEQPKRAYPPAENNVYVGQDGSVYRRTQQGWETHGEKGWAAYKPEQNPHVDNTPQHSQQPALNNGHEVAPAHELPRDQGAAHVTPAHETPAHETPARVEPVRSDPPALEQERAARERGSASEQRSGPAEQHAPNAGGSGAGGNAGGGGRGNGGGPKSK